MTINPPEVNLSLGLGSLRFFHFDFLTRLTEVWFVKTDWLTDDKHLKLPIGRNGRTPHHERALVRGEVSSCHPRQLTLEQGGDTLHPASAHTLVTTHFIRKADGVI